MNSHGTTKSILLVGVACALVAALVGYVAGRTMPAASEPAPVQETAQAQETVQAADAATTGHVTLDGWREDSEALAALTAFVDSSVDEASEGYIPPEDRIAVFDMDGTLMGERFPTYFSDWLCVWRALDDDTYAAPEDMREKAEGWRDEVLAGEEMLESERREAMRLFEGLSVEEFKDVVRRFKEVPAWGFSGMTYGESFFRPMVSVVRYLHERGYTVYICSGTWRDALRAMSEGTLDEWIPVERVIGTDILLVAANQGGEDGVDHTMVSGEQVLVGDHYLTKNLKANKVYSIAHEIGRRPVLAFGNSGGDISMGAYTLDNPDYEGQAFMLLCDDTERDYGDTDVADAFAAKCEAAGFHTVSMRDDWTTIYGEGVQKTDASDQGAELADAA